MQKIYISLLGNTLFESFFYFCWWSLFGWFLEVVVRTLETGGFENRGFLNGPFCPIYGFGVMIITTLLDPIKHNFVILYFTSMIICSIVELSVGLLMEKLFHAKWWDYSKEKFNYRGFICLRISLLWGVGSVMVIRIVQPLIAKAVGYIPHMFGNILAYFIIIVIIIDLAATLADIRNFNKKLKQVDYIASLLHDKSIAIGENISEEVLSLNAKYEKLSDQIKSSRIVRAFPNMTPVLYNHTFKMIKDKINKSDDYDIKYENIKLIIENEKENKKDEDKVL